MIQRRIWPFNPWGNSMFEPRDDWRERREYFRITMTLPIAIQLEADRSCCTCTPQPVNVSAGGIGFVSDLPYRPGDIVVVSLQLTHECVFRGLAEVLRRDPVPQGIGRYRVRARFLNLHERDRQ